MVKYDAFGLIIDTAHCNLRCAMCPRGGVNRLENPDKGLMSFELFTKIVDKFVDENIKVSYLEIGNWGEPLLNPDLPKMIRYAKSKPGFMSQDAIAYIFTNLNYLPHPSALLESGIDEIKIAISGMSQQVYSKNHIGGNVRSVISNILELVKIRSKKNLEKVKLTLLFHDYIYNKEEAKLAEEFCNEHGLVFTCIRIFICGVEDAVYFHENEEKMSEYYGKFIDLEREKSLMKTIDYASVRNCIWRKARITVNFNGQLYRCCGVFPKKHFMGSIFDFKIKDILNIKSEICSKCAEVPLSWRKVI